MSASPNLMGARFTASEQALAPVLRETAKRGLIYFDDGASPRSLASQIAGANNLAFAKADVVIDAVPTAADIDQRAGAARDDGARARRRGRHGECAAGLDRAHRQWAKAAEAAASCWCRSPPWSRKAEVELTSRRAQQRIVK